MEALGGGGHQTMAAAQMENETIDSVIEKICGIIDDNTNN
jgi:c-di-AMP phosphodiesterase-like protein